MSELELATQAATNLERLSAGTLITIVGLVVLYLILRREGSKAKEDQAQRAQAMERDAAIQAAQVAAQKAHNDTLMSVIGALNEEVKSNRTVMERVIGLQDETNQANGAVVTQLEKQSGLITLAIGETADQIRKTREDIGGVGGKVDGVDQKIALIVPAVDGGIDRMRLFIEDSTNKLSTQQAVQTAKLITSMSEILDRMQSALSDNFQQTAAGNAELYKTVKDGLQDLQETVSKITRIEVVKPADAPKRDTAQVVQLYDDNGLTVVPKTTTTNGIHKVEPPTPETKPEDPKI